MLTLSDLKLGVVIERNHEPYQIVSASHSKQARGGAVLKTKLKNLLSGATLEHTFAGSDTAQEADIKNVRANFLYKDGDKYFFMDNATFEQFEFLADQIGESVKYLTDGQEVNVMIFNDRPVAISLPTKLALTVTLAPDGVKGNSAGAVTKSVTLETGVEIRVPLFIKSGDKIVVNTETGEYVERV